MGPMGYSYCTAYQFSELLLTSELETQSMVSLDLYFVFIFMRAENAVSHM